MSIVGRFVVTSQGLMGGAIWVSSVDEKNRPVSWCTEKTDAHIFQDVSSAIECKHSVCDYRSDFCTIQGIE